MTPQAEERSLPATSRWPRQLHQILSGTLIVAGSITWMVAAKTRQGARWVPEHEQEWTLSMWAGAAVFIAGNIWYFAGWLATLRSERPVEANVASSAEPTRHLSQSTAANAPKPCVPAKASGARPSPKP